MNDAQFDGWRAFLAQLDPRAGMLKARVYGRWLVLTQYDKIVFDRECADEAEAIDAAAKINAWPTPREKKEAERERQALKNCLFIRDSKIVDIRGVKVGPPLVFW